MIGTSAWDEVGCNTWTNEDDAFNLDFDKFKVSEHIDIEALVDTRDFWLEMEPCDAEILKKRSKVNEERLLHKYSGIKFFDKDDDVVRAPISARPARSPTASHLKTPSLADEHK